MKIITYKCPQCGGDLEVKEGNPISFCQYCGAKINLEDDSELVRLAQVGAGLLRDAGKEVSDYQKRKEIRKEEKEKHSWKYTVALFAMVIFWMIIVIVAKNFGL